MESEQIKEKYPRLEGLVWASAMVSALVYLYMIMIGLTEPLLDAWFNNFQVMGVHLASIIALALCGVDLAGLFKFFNPEWNLKDDREPLYLLIAWTIWIAIHSYLGYKGINLLTENTVPLFLAKSTAMFFGLVRILFVSMFIHLGRYDFKMGDLQKDLKAYSKRTVEIRFGRNL